MKKYKKLSMQKTLLRYQAVIFDVDGTLYFQPRLRFYMACRLLSFYALHPLRLKELYILRKYRQARELWNEEMSDRNSELLEEDQYRYVAEKCNSSQSEVASIVHLWIHEIPLAYLTRCKDIELSRLIRELREHSILTAAYSDYPLAAKLEALHIEMDYLFCSTDAEIGCMKPDPAGMQVILDRLKLPPSDVLMIGDRYEKDGIAAINKGMDYIILDASMPKRVSLYQQLKNLSGITP